MVDRAFEVLEFIKRYTTNFSPIFCFRVLYFSRVCSVLEYDVAPLPSHNELQIERIPNRYLSFAALLLKINDLQHDYSSIYTILKIPTLASRQIDANYFFIICLPYDSLDVPNIFFSISVSSLPT